VDFWRVEAIEADRLLLLRSEMRVPGDAWLEFNLEPRASGGTLVRLEAFFEPRGLRGRLYWYALLPVHRYVFEGMLHSLEEAVCAGPVGRRDAGVGG
jgi:hypothetical protein